MLARIAENGDVEPSFEYRKNIRCRWLVGDFRHLVEVWRGAPKGYPGRFPRRLQTLLSVLTPVAGTYHDNFMLTDPLPELGDWLSLVQRVFSADSKEKVHAQGRYSHP